LPRRRKPRSYIDTNVILDYIRKRDDDSTYLLKTIARKRLKSYTTAYSLLELLDRQQEDAWIEKRVKAKESFEDILRQRYPRQLNKAELDNVFEQVDKKFLKQFVDSEIIYVGRPTQDSWDEIIDLMHDKNISIGDAFHFVMAKNQGCNVFITKDGNLAKMVEENSDMIAGEPSKINEKMKAKGIQPFW
jgi:predicted nucleic acid-binding protein